MRARGETRPDQDETDAFFTTSEARDLLLRARGPTRTGSSTHPFAQLRVLQWNTAVVAAATALALHGETGDLVRVADALAEVERHEWPGSPLLTALWETLRSFVRDVWPAPEAKALTSHPSTTVREILARALEGKWEEPEAVAILGGLAGDLASRVRASARKVLPEGHLPPWYGVFSADPIPEAEAWARRSATGSSEAAARKARKLVQELCATFVKGPWAVEEGAIPKLAARLDLLPDALVVDLASHVGDLDELREPSPILQAAACREGGVDLVVSYVERWIARRVRFVDSVIAKVIEGAPVAVRHALGFRLLARSSELDEPARTKMLGDALPLLPGADPARLVPWAIATVDELPSSRLEDMCDTLEGVVGDAASDLVSWAQRALEAGTAFSTPGRAALTRVALGKLAPDARRELAQRLVATDDEDLPAPWEIEGDRDAHVRGSPERRWALEILVGLDEEGPQTDPAAAHRLFDDPKNRACFLSSRALVPYVLPPAREALRRGELSFREARLVAGAVCDLSGTDRAIHRSDYVEENLARFGHEALAPLDAQELEAYFVARRGHSFEGPGVALADFGVVGSSSAEGATLIDALVSSALAGDSRAIHTLKRELAVRPSRELVDAVTAAFPRDPDAQYGSLAVAADMAEGELANSDYYLRRTQEMSMVRPGVVARPDDALLPLPRARALLQESAARVDDAGYAGVEGFGLPYSHHRACAAFAMAVCALHSDTSILAQVAAVLEWDTPDAVVNDAAAEVLEVLVGLSSAKDAAVRKLAKRDAVGIREALARGLRAEEPEARALLLALATDVNGDVRNVARTALGEGAVPWWTGIFSRDPTDLVSDEEADRLAPVFAAIVEELGPRPVGARRRSEAAIAELSRALPFALAKDLALRASRVERFGVVFPPWVGPAVEREGGLDIVLEILALPHESTFAFSGAIEKLVSFLSPADRSRFVVEAIGRTSTGDAFLRTVIARHLTKLARPRDADAIAEAILELDHEECEALPDVCADWVPWFELRRTMPERLVAWAIACLEEPPDEDHAGKESLVRCALKKAPRETVRKLALGALAQPGRRVWALRELLGRCHEPSLDGPRSARMRAFYEDPELRAAFLKDDVLLRLALPLARQDLVDGRLELRDAWHVAETIVRASETSDDVQSSSSSRRARGRSAPSKARPKKPRIPPLTRAEREAYVGLRGTVRFEGEAWRILDFDVLGVESPEARAHLDAALEAVQSGDDEAADAIGLMLHFHPRTEVFLATGFAMARVYDGAGIPERLCTGLARACQRLGIEPEVPLVPRVDDYDLD